MRYQEAAFIPSRQFFLQVFYETGFCRPAVNSEQKKPMHR